MGLVLTHALTDGHRAFATVRRTVGDARVERSLHQVVVLRGRVVLDQQAAITLAAAEPQHQLVAAGVDQVVRAFGGQSRAHHLLHVVDELRVVGLDQRVEADRHVGRDTCEIEQRFEQEPPVERRVDPPRQRLWIGSHAATAAMSSHSGNPSLGSPARALCARSSAAGR